MFVIFFLLCGLQQVYAQQDYPFYESIREFKKQDSISFPKKGGILFIGSSSIRRWTDLESRFKKYPIIQRGFGGSEYKDILHYSDDIIFPYQPSKIVLYAGENDFVKGRSVEEIYNTLLALYSKIRTNLPEAYVYFISVKPSEKLIEYHQSIKEFNGKMKQFIDREPNYIRYIDIYHPMLNEKGEPKPELFMADQLHINASGYDIWENEIRKQLEFIN